MASLRSFMIISIFIVYSAYFRRVEKPETDFIFKSHERKLWVFYPDDLYNGDTVEVYWYGISNASINDEIRIYCPTTLEDNKILEVFTHKKFPEIGKPNGKISVKVFYERSTCEFRYFSISKTDFVKIATSNPIVFKNSPSDPLQIHLAYTDHQSEMRVSWVSGVDSTPCVSYGKTAGNLNMNECGETTTYNDIQMCEPIATTDGFIDPGFQHSVVLKNLENDTQYFYRIDGPKTEILSFTSAVFTSKNADRKISFAVFGDVDVTPYPGAYGTIDSVEAQLKGPNPLNFVFHVGDISYAMGKGYIWTKFGTMIEKVASKIPYMMVIGNHEHNTLENYEKNPSHGSENFRPFPDTYSNDSGGECGVPMYHRYKMPENGNSIFWYSFDSGNLHSIVLSSEDNFTRESPQYKWLEKDLQGVNREMTPWVVVYIHRSLYSSAPFLMYDEASTIIKQHLEPLLLKYYVNFVISGHYHTYERTCALNKGICVEIPVSKSNWGIVHLTVGTGGRELSAPETEFNEWLRVALFEYGMGRLDILNRREAQWSFIENKNRKTLDSLNYSFILE